MKTFKKVDLVNIVSRLQLETNEFSNLDVKNELRAEGFFATQHQVKTMMNQLIQNKTVAVKSYSPYKKYTGVDVDADLKDVHSIRKRKRRSDAFILNFKDDTFQYIRKDGEHVEAILKVNALDDNSEYWLAQYGDDEIWVSKMYTRDIARQAIASYAKVSFNKTKARTYKR